jgi:hypothetical protein
MSSVVFDLMIRLCQLSSLMILATAFISVLTAKAIAIGLMVYPLLGVIDYFLRKFESDEDCIYHE